MAKPSIVGNKGIKKINFQSEGGISGVVCIFHGERIQCLKLAWTLGNSGCLQEEETLSFAEDWGFLTPTIVGIHRMKQETM